MQSPSGEQCELAFEDQRVVVTEVGGGLRGYSVGERQVLDGYGVDEMCSAGRGQVLAPWPNRIADASYEFGGVRHELPVNERASQSAIHGFVRWVPWTVPEREPHRVVVEHELHPQPGYPFALSFRIEYALSERGLHVSTTAANVGANSCPFGIGAHPYLRPGTPTVDVATLRLPARSVLATDEHGVAAALPVHGTELDFLQPRAVGTTRLDHCFTDLERDEDGLAHVVLADPATGTGVTLWVDDAYRYLMLYTGDDRPDVSRRSLAVEPMTCPPQAFCTGESVIVLAPGDSMTATWGLTPS
jgi:aldose 1-epimerase